MTSVKFDWLFKLRAWTWLVIGCCCTIDWSLDCSAWYCSCGWSSVYREDSKKVWKYQIRVWQVRPSTDLGIHCLHSMKNWKAKGKSVEIRNMLHPEQPNTKPWHPTNQKSASWQDCGRPYHFLNSTGSVVLKGGHGKKIEPRIMTNASCWKADAKKIWKASRKH